MSLPASFAALTCLALHASPLALAQLSVVQVSPARNALFAPTAGAIEVQCNQPLADFSVTPASFQVFGRWSGPRAGTLEVQGALIRFEPERPFFPGEQVTVALSQTVQTWTGDVLSGGHVFQFWTRSSPGSGIHQQTLSFEVKLPGESIAQAYGICAADLDADGDPDFSIPCEITSDVRVFENLGCGTFSGPALHALPSGSYPSPNDTADFDHDGKVDLAVGNIVGNTVSVLFGSATPDYEPAVTYPSGSAPRALAAIDVDADGDADLVVANLNSSDLSLHRNQGNGSFAPPTFFEGGGQGESALAAVDADSDGIWDLFVGHRNSQTATCLLGDGTGGFQFVDSTPIGGQAWMMASGDIDADGDVDVSSANSAQGNAGIARNDGTGHWASAQTLIAGGFTIATDLGDLDADGDLDLVLSNYATADWTIYRNDGAGNFALASTLSAGQAGSCMTIVDHDRDGDMDLIGIDELADQVLVFEHLSFAPFGVESGDCAGRLRVDNLAGWSGFGSAPPHDIEAGAKVFFGLSGKPFTTPILAFGLAKQPGFGVVSGTLNLTAPVLVPMGPNSAKGANLLAIPMPLGLPAGLEIAVQAWDAGSLTNAEVLRF